MAVKDTVRSHLIHLRADKTTVKPFRERYSDLYLMAGERLSGTALA